MSVAGLSPKQPVVCVQKVKMCDPRMKLKNKTNRRRGMVCSGRLQDNLLLESNKVRMRVKMIRLDRRGEAE